MRRAGIDDYDRAVYIFASVPLPLPPRLLLLFPLRQACGRSSGLPLDRLLPPSDMLLAMKSSNRALTAKVLFFTGHKHLHSGCHLDRAGRFSMTSPSDHVILALSNA